jgi:peptide/nickel transport system permease protein
MYVLVRLGQAAVVVLLVSLITFVLLHILPGGPARSILGRAATPAQIARFNHDEGYDQPWPEQYVRWVQNSLEGNLGFSRVLNQPVAEAIGDRLPKTVVLTLAATLAAIALAIPVGTLQAVRRNQWSDHVLTGLQLLLYGTPAYLMGFVLILVFAVWLRWLPAEAPQSESVAAILASPQGLVLPVGTLAVIIGAQFSRYVRSSVIETLSQDFVRTAAAKGVPPWAILWRHVLPNSLISIVTILGLWLPFIMGGTLITEVLFNYPGMGVLFWTAAQADDFPILLGVVTVLALAVVVGNLLADLVYGLLDPRTRKRPA